MLSTFMRSGWSILALALVMAWACWRAARAIDAARGMLPVELLEADLLFSEKRFGISEPVRLSARLDRAYRLSSGQVVLLELKTRRASRVYLSDVVQLSVQRIVVEHEARVQVAPYGYVLTQSPEGVRRTRRVKLMTPVAVFALIDRREGILAGRLEPRAAASRGVCTNCVYRAVCPDRRR